MIARSLPTSRLSGSTTAADKVASKGRRHNGRGNHDGKASHSDIPRAFARIMAFKVGVKPNHGLDDGERSSKRHKRAVLDDVTGQLTALSRDLKHSVPSIMPGERMVDFSARVDNALPMGGLVSKGGGKNPPGVKLRQTKLEKKMQKMQDEWRQTDARWKERLKETQEEAEEEAEEYGVSARIWNSTKKNNNKKKNNDHNSKADYENDEDDPWASVAQARREQATTGLVGLHDVVEAPPKFSHVPKEKLKMRNGVKVDVLDVPGIAGSLRRREELSHVRRSTVEAHREIMKGKRKSSSR